MHNLRLHVIPLTNEEKDSNGKPVKPYPLLRASSPNSLIVSILSTRAPISNSSSIRSWIGRRGQHQINTDAAGRRTLGNQIAAGIPGKIVCFLRWGSGSSPTGNGNAYPPPGAGPKPSHVDDVEQNYVALPNRIVLSFGLLNQGNGAFVAHELGHYLGLYHTFPGWTDLDGPLYEKFGGHNALCFPGRSGRDRLHSETLQLGVPARRIAGSNSGACVVCVRGVDGCAYRWLSPISGY